MGREPISSNELFNAALKENEVEGLVANHLAARTVERCVLLITSAIGMIGLVILLAVLLQNQL
jgi:hypothetical protein